jgi:hypothetical protein
MKTLRIMILSSMGLFVTQHKLHSAWITFSIMTFSIIWSIQYRYAACHSAQGVFKRGFTNILDECHAECHEYLNLMLSILMLSVVMLNVIMLSVVILNVVMLSAVAPLLISPKVSLKMCHSVVCQLKKCCCATFLASERVGARISRCWFCNRWGSFLSAVPNVPLIQLD